MSKLENYYGKFCEDKRLLSRHGQVEYTTSMKYIHKYLKPEDRILDIGAGTGGSLTLAHSQNSQMSFMYGFFFVKFLFFAVVCVVIVI